MSQPEHFVEVVKREKPDLLLLSCLYTVTMHSMEDTIIALKKAGLKERVKILVGGSAHHPGVCQQYRRGWIWSRCGGGG